MGRLRSYNNANDAFVDLFNIIKRSGVDFGNTKALFNIGFEIQNPLDRSITCKHRGWSEKYAKREWEWYLSRDRSVVELKKYAPIWDKMHNGDNLVNSNYGYQWNRSDQLSNAINELKRDRNSRRAVVTILDSKEWEGHSFDTPCTNSIHFQIVNNKLCMTVNMRSNDLWYGFCNDQYCFSNLQEQVAIALDIKVGWYYHFSSNLHLYYDQIK